MTTRPYPLYNNVVDCSIPVPDMDVRLPSVMPVEVAIVYGDLDAGRRALRLLADLAVSLTDEVEFQPQLWRLSLLESPEIRVSLAGDFARAKIIILAPGNAALSSDVRAWIEQGVEREEGNPSAIVVMVMDGVGAAESSFRMPDAFKPTHGGRLVVTGTKRISGSLPE